MNLKPKSFSLLTVIIVATALFLYTTYRTNSSIAADTVVSQMVDTQRTYITNNIKPYKLGDVARIHVFEDIYLASQPKPEDFAQAKRIGVKTVINLRHAAEIKDFDEKQVVESEGMIYINIPFLDPAELTDTVFDMVRKHLKSAVRPILLHCASANRVGAVWLPYRVLDGGLIYDEALAEAKTVGLRSPAYESNAREYIEKRR